MAIVVSSHPFKMLALKHSKSNGTFLAKLYIKKLSPPIFDGICLDDD
jgi:hypothetical protein